jgi:long-chain acyl-CoA synthetase
MVPFNGPSPPGSMGMPLPDTEARIVDSETGTRLLPAGEIGELTVRGPQVMQGYWRRPEATRAALRDGWLYTGDLARMDADGFFTIVERKDDLIITHGFNVYPSEIEAVLKRHPGVHSTAVVGVADRLRGQAIVAYVVPDNDRPPTRENLLAHCRRELPDHKVPKRLNLVDEIPHSPVGKPLRKTLRDAEQRA